MDRERDDRRAIALSAAGILGGGTFVGLVESAIPGGERISWVPTLFAMALAALVARFGPRTPRRVLVLLGPLGAALIAVALTTNDGPGDGAVLYMWPVLWMAYFYGNRGTAFIVVWVGIVHGVALWATPRSGNHLDRWIDVVVAVLVVAVVVRSLAARNDQLVATLVAEARVDTLTGLLNRRGFEERIAIEVSHCVREGESLALVAFDIDHFKRVNDEHGHEVGDRVLAWLGAVLDRETRGADVAARIGGEEFVVVLPHGDIEAGHRLAERVRNVVGSTGAAGVRESHGVSGELALTISCGVAAAAPPRDAQSLLEAADQALYAAKRTGRNRTVDAGTMTRTAVPAAVREGLAPLGG